MVPLTMEKELESQIHLFKSYEDAKSHALDMASRKSPQAEAHNLEQDGPIEYISEAGELCRLEKQGGKWVAAKRSGPSPNKDASKKFASNACFRCGRTTHRIADCKESLTIHGIPCKPEEAA